MNRNDLSEKNTIEITNKKISKDIESLNNINV